MKSRITIDVDHDNQPILKIEYQASEDVRDKLVKKFLETFGGESFLAEFYFVSLSSDVYTRNNSTALVRPLSPHDVVLRKSSIDQLVSYTKKFTETNLVADQLADQLINAGKTDLEVE